MPNAGRSKFNITNMVSAWTDAHSEAAIEGDVVLMAECVYWGEAHGLRVCT